MPLPSLKVVEPDLLCAGAVGMNGVGIAGMNWDVQLLACKFINQDGIGWVSGVIDCLDFCVRNNATISSNSYALSDTNATSAILQDAIAQAGAQGHLYVTAAGEQGGCWEQKAQHVSFSACHGPQLLVAKVEANLCSQAVVRGFTLSLALCRE